MHDLVIAGGSVVDGSGAPARHADVAVANGRIVDVGEDIGSAHRTIDADGLLVTPGWVDMHTHYDAQVTWDPHLTPSGWHGVTTVVMGNCGVGFGPSGARSSRLADRSDGGCGRHPRCRAARGNFMGMGDVPRIPRRSRPSVMGSRRRNPTAPRSASGLRDE